MSPVTLYDAFTQLIHNYKLSWWTNFNREGLHSCTTQRSNALSLINLRYGNSTVLRSTVQGEYDTYFNTDNILKLLFDNLHLTKLESLKWGDGFTNRTGFPGTGDFAKWVVKKEIDYIILSLEAYIFICSW